MKGATRVSLLLIVMSMTSSYLFAQFIVIETKNNHIEELVTKAMLEQLMTRYDLSKWLFTKKIVIDHKTSIPHSHPVLTLNTRHNKDEELLLSTFIHEQLHWFVKSKSRTSCDSAVVQLKRQFPNAAVGYPMGGVDLESSYLHLIVNYLENSAMKQLLGELKADQIIRFWMNDHYTWIYEQIHNRGFLIYKILKENELLMN